MKINFVSKLMDACFPLFLWPLVFVDAFEVLRSTPLPPGLVLTLLFFFFPVILIRNTVLVRQHDVHFRRCNRPAAIETSETKVHLFLNSLV